MASLTVTSAIVEAKGPITIEWSGFRDGYWIYIDFLSGPPEFGPYPHRGAYRIGNTSSGKLDTRAPYAVGVYEWQARQEVTELKSNIVKVNVVERLPPVIPPEWIIAVIAVFGIIGTAIAYPIISEELRKRG